MGKKHDTAEICISRYLDEDQWRIETNDKTTAAMLKRRGWAVFGDDEDADYWSFLVPLKAVSLRSKKTVDGFASRAPSESFLAAANTGDQAPAEAHSPSVDSPEAG